MQRKSLSSPLLAIFGTIAVVGAPLLAPRVVRADTKSTVQAKTSAFYRWYVGRLNDNDDPLRDRAMMRRSLSNRLAKWIYSPAYKEYGADYFIDAQDFDKDWGSVRTSNFRLSGSTTTLTAILGKPKPNQTGIGEWKLRLKWVREGGTWKLDRVNGH